MLDYLRMQFGDAQTTVQHCGLVAMQACVLGASVLVATDGTAMGRRSLLLCGAQVISWHCIRSLTSRWIASIASCHGEWVT